MTEFAWRLWHRLRWGHPYYTTTFSRTFNHRNPCSRCRAATRPAAAKWARDFEGPSCDEPGCDRERGHIGDHRADPATRPAEDAGERP